MKKSLLWLTVIMLCVSIVAVFSLAGCKEAAPAEGAVEEEAAPAEKEATEEESAEISEIEGTPEELREEEIELPDTTPWKIEFEAEKGLIFSDYENTPGPHGELAGNLDEHTLTVEDILKFRREPTKIKAIAVFHFDGVWTQQQARGFQDIADLLGWDFEVLEGSDFSVDKQTAILENAMVMEPDVIFATPVSEKEQVAIYKKIADAGICLVMISLAPPGMEYNKDYAAIVSRDNVGIGVLSADLLAKYMGNKGKVGTVTLGFYHESVTRIYDGFLETIEKYKDIEIVYEGKWTEFGEVTSQVEAMLAKNPDITGIVADWSVPTMEAVAAARTMGRTPDDLSFITYDLEADVTTELASGGLIKAIVSDDPYKGGLIAGIAAARAILGKASYPFLAAPVTVAEREQIPQIWGYRYHEAPPEEIMDLLE